jgi:hypothetical protein
MVSELDMETKIIGLPRAAVMEQRWWCKKKVAPRRGVMSRTWSDAYTTIEALDEALLASQRALTRLLSHFSLIWRTPSFEALPRTSLVRQIARLGRYVRVRVCVRVRWCVSCVVCGVWCT